MSNIFQKIPLAYQKATILNKNVLRSQLYSQIANFQVKVYIKILKIGSFPQVNIRHHASSFAGVLNTVPFTGKLTTVQILLLQSICTKFHFPMYFVAKGTNLWSVQNSYLYPNEIFLLKEKYSIWVCILFSLDIWEIPSE